MLRRPSAWNPRDPWPDLQRVSTGLGGYPFTRGHQVELLINGDDAFRSMLQALYRARHYILVTFFIVKYDRIGRAFQEALIDRARNGIRVLFMIDSIGSHQLPRSYVNALREAGVQVCAFDTTKGRGNRFQLNFRNHRKIVIVDGEECFAGGLNLGDEYLGQNPHLGPWRDTHLRFTGPAVADLQQVFLRDWYWAAEEIPALRWPGEATAEPGVLLQVMPTGPADELPSCQLFFLQLMDTARERLWITSPYFVPDGSILSALQRASLRGVDVRLLLPDRPDHLLVYLSSYTYYGPMLEAGVNIYRYHAGFMHQKVILVDRLLTGIGTANLDNRSFHRILKSRSTWPTRPLRKPPPRCWNRTSHGPTGSRRTTTASAPSPSGPPAASRTSCPRCSRGKAPLQDVGGQLGQLGALALRAA